MRLRAYEAGGQIAEDGAFTDHLVTKNLPTWRANTHAMKANDALTIVLGARFTPGTWTELDDLGVSGRTRCGGADILGRHLQAAIFWRGVHGQFLYRPSGPATNPLPTALAGGLAWPGPARLDGSVAAKHVNPVNWCGCRLQTAGGSVSSARPECERVAPAGFLAETLSRIQSAMRSDCGAGRSALPEPTDVDTTTHPGRPRLS